MSHTPSRSRVTDQNGPYRRKYFWMFKRLHQARSRSWFSVAFAAIALCAAAGVQAQFGAPMQPEKPSHSKHAKGVQPHLAPTASQPPSVTIPAGPLGFTAPGPLYLGLRNSLASLDFLDENTLLFTFRVPGLIRRDPAIANEDTERQIRALVLALPAGSVLAEALWTVHDRSRYLWMLRDGRFLLRDRDLLQTGDAALVLKPLFRFPGPLTWLELDPSLQYLVTNSFEPEAAKSPSAAPPSGAVASPSTAAASISVDNQPPESPKDTIVRILRRDSGKVMLVSRSRSAVHLPINADGYLEALRANGEQWALNLNYFAGGSSILGYVDSGCAPALDFVAPRELLATACDRFGAAKIVAIATDGRKLWEHPSAPTAVWPLLVRSPDGSRLARESLTVDHPVNAFSPLESGDIKGQLVQILDAATGNVVLTAAASPVLDAGGNVAISPSGRRAAVIVSGAIQVFDLPPPPGPAPSPAP